jgi:hypothetical protein
LTSPDGRVPASSPSEHRPGRALRTSLDPWDSSTTPRPSSTSTTTSRRRPAPATPGAEPPTRVTDRFRVVPASYVFLLAPGRLGRRRTAPAPANTGYMDGHWAAAAAGHVERGETAYDAARRRRARRSGSSSATCPS